MCIKILKKKNNKGHYPSNCELLVIPGSTGNRSLSRPMMHLCNTIILYNIIMYSGVSLKQFKWIINTKVKI